MDVMIIQILTRLRPILYNCMNVVYIDVDI